MIILKNRHWEVYLIRNNINRMSTRVIEHTNGKLDYLYSFFVGLCFKMPIIILIFK